MELQERWLIRRYIDDTGLKEVEIIKTNSEVRGNYK